MTKGQGVSKNIYVRLTYLFLFVCLFGIEFIKLGSIMRFGRSGKDHIMRFGRSDPEQSEEKRKWVKVAKFQDVF